MKILCRGILKGLLVAGILLPVAVSTAHAAPPIRLVVLGDSLMSGYQLQPEQAFPRKLERKLREYGFDNVEVINMSEAGMTTAGGLERIQQVVNQRPDVVVLALGANDALRGINNGVIFKNMTIILTKLYEIQAYIVMIGMKAPSNMGYTYSAQFEQGYRSLAGAYKANLYPFALEGVVGNPELNLADGYHPNAKGVDVMVERIYPYVDAGVRQKWNINAYNQQYQGQMQNYMSTEGTVAMPSANPQVSSPQAVPIPGALPQ